MLAAAAESIVSTEPRQHINPRQVQAGPGRQANSVQAGGRQAV